MKNRATKIMALALCAVLLFGVMGTAAYALGDSRETEKSEEKAADTSAAVDAVESKDETVYVLAGADGAVQKVIVSDWLQNAAGEDFYSQTEIEQELPVSLTVSYRLDGEPVQPENLAGKSGRVTIRFDYTNRQNTLVEIDGKQEKIYVPFAVLTGLLLDNDTFSNVEVSNGRLVNDGSRTAVIGFAFPGLQENLKLDSEKLEIPSYVEVTADAVNFELGMTMTLVTNEIFNELDAESLDSVDELRESLDQMTDAMDQLTDGSSQLYDGLCTLLEQSGVLVDGINQLAAGSKTLRDGVSAVDAGASQLETGADQLYTGLNTLAANNDALNSGARQVFETLLSAANDQLTAAGLSIPALTVENYAEVLNGIIASLDGSALYEEALSTVTAAVEENRDYITEQVTAAVYEELTNQVTAAVQEQVTAQVTEAVHESVTAQVISTATGMDPEDYSAAVEAGLVDGETQAAVSDAIEAQKQSDEVAQAIAANTEAQMASDPVQTTIAANVEEQKQSDAVLALIAENTELQVQKAISENMASDAVQSQLAAASEGVQSLIALKSSLDSYNSFYLGLQSYTAGVAQAAAGAGELKDGAASLRDGSGQLYAGASGLCDGLSAMQNSVPALTDGITQLRDGAMQLSDGIKEFREESVQKLVEFTDDDLENLMTRIQATIDVAKDYRSFSEVDSQTDGQLKFIYRTDSIAAD